MTGSSRICTPLLIFGYIQSLTPSISVGSFTERKKIPAASLVQRTDVVTGAHDPVCALSVCILLTMQVHVFGSDTEA